MISRLGRYVARTVVASSVLVLAVLVALDSLITLFGETGSLGKGGYTMIDALVYVLLTVPSRLYQLFPAAVAIGGVVGLGALAAHSELVVMRAAGVSTRRIVGMVMAGGVVLMVGIILVGEFVAPSSQQLAERMRASEIAGQSSVYRGTALWVRDDNRFVNVGQVLPGRVLRDVRVYEFDDRRLEQALHAARARYDGERWHLADVRATRLVDGVLRARRTEATTWDELVRPDLFRVLTVSPDTLPAWRLRRYVRYLRANQLESARFALAFWQKIATPVSTVVMLLLALPAVFGGMRTMGTGQRVFVGSIIGIGYFLLSELFSHIGIVYGLVPPLAVLAPAILFTGVGIVLLYRSI